MTKINIKSSEENDRPNTPKRKKNPSEHFHEGHRIRTNISLSFFLFFILKVDRIFLSNFFLFFILQS